MTRKLLIAVGLPLLIGCLAAVPAALALGPSQWGFAGLGFSLSIAPGAVVIGLGEYLVRLSPFGRLVALFAGVIVRLAVAFGGGVAVFLIAGPAARADRIAYWLWVLFAYLTCLAVETALMAAGPKTRRTGTGVAEGGGNGG